MRGRTLGNVLTNRSQLRRLQNEQQIDATVYHSLWSWVLLGLGLQSNVPSVLWFHDAVQHMHVLERVGRLERPDAMIANSRYTASTVSRMYRRPDAEVIFYPFCEPKCGERRNIRESLDTHEDDAVIVQVSRLEPYKGHRLHLEALARLKDLSGWKVWFVGGKQRPAESAYWEELQNSVTRLGIADRVRFLGQRTDTADILAAADIHCQPNIGPEPFGLTFVEALSAGLPVVTTDLGAAPEIVTTECGILVAPNDANALAGALRSLITDRGLRASLAARGAARAKAICNPDVQLRELFRVLSAARRPIQADVRGITKPTIN
jgi:glycosyltransferase involved in cell wall biosynthesis